MQIPPTWKADDLWNTQSQGLKLKPYCPSKDWPCVKVRPESITVLQRWGKGEDIILLTHSK